MAKLGVLVLHGMGNQGADFAEEMIQKLNSRIEQAGFPISDVIYKTVYWAPIFQEKETELLRKLKQGGDMDYSSLREFVIYYLADALAYQKVTTDQQDIDVYEGVGTKIKTAVSELYSDLKRSTDDGTSEFPMLIMAHSLGCQMISNYVWDTHKKNEATNSFERMDNIAGIVTFGCNMPLFTIAYNKLLPITFPGVNVGVCYPHAEPERIADAVKWFNFYDKDDILGYPLKTLSPEYSRAVSEDVQINVGGILSSWNPASHACYWTDKNFVRPVAEMIVKLLRLGN